MVYNNTSHSICVSTYSISHNTFVTVYPSNICQTCTHIFPHPLPFHLWFYCSVLPYTNNLIINSPSPPHSIVPHCLTFKNGCALLEQILPFMCENLMNLFLFLQSNTQHIFTLRKPWTLKEVLKIYRSVLYSGVWNRGVSLYVYMYVAVVMAWSRICWKCITIYSSMQFSKCL